MFLTRYDDKDPELYNLILVWMTLASIIQGHICMKTQNFSVHFLANLSIDLEDQYVAITYWFVVFIYLLVFKAQPTGTVTSRPDTLQNLLIIWACKKDMVFNTIKMAIKKKNP